MARRPPDKIEKILTALKRESDRGCVLVSAAWVEEQLRMGIDAIIEQTSSRYGHHPVDVKEFDSLTNSLLNGALNRASSRVTYCRAIGMIDAGMAAGLEALFSLRNDHFAHFAGVSRLTDPRVKDQLCNLLKAVMPSEYVNGKLHFPHEPIKRNKKQSKARFDFLSAVMTLSIRLHTDMLVFSNAIRAGNRPAKKVTTGGK